MSNFKTALNMIIDELKEHYPFTLFGALTGILLMMLFKDIKETSAHRLFYIFHPIHISMSAYVTASLYKKYLNGNSFCISKFLKILVIGYIGSVSIGTLSDSIIPFWGEKLLNMHNPHPHIGFIDKWWLINPIAIVTVIIAYNFPATKLPHTSHVLISTWASLFHMLMAAAGMASVSYFGVFVFLFVAVWLPCCVSDIIFPLLFVGDKSC